jgi:PIN domain nuclease of toxin-antitoxin system
MHLVVWASEGFDTLPAAAQALFEETGAELVYSVASLWEMAIRGSRRRGNLATDLPVLRRGLLDGGWEELPVLAAQALAAGPLPPIHHDPFDRLLRAQATAEGMLLVTADRTLASYTGPVRLV